MTTSKVYLKPYHSIMVKDGNGRHFDYARSALGEKYPEAVYCYIVYDNISGGGMYNSNGKWFVDLEEAKKHMDEHLISLGYVLLTAEQVEKLEILV